MDAHYRHTQVGWVVIASAIGVAALIGPTLRSAHLPFGPSLVVALVMLALLLFTTLTVEVDGEQIRVGFTIGLVRKRIPLRDVQQYREVRDRWYYGWGIRALPGGWLWNVSGLDAVELVLRSGRRFRIGTDEPASLAAAIAQALGQPPSVVGEGTAPEPPGVPKAPAFGLAVGALLLLGTAFVGGIFYSQVQPPMVTVSPEGFKVDCLFYGDAYAMSEVTGISLEPALPHILARTNGFAGAGTLRGRFRVEGLGEGKLFVEEGYAPFVLVRLHRGFVIVNFRRPEKTQALFEELKSHWPAR